MYWCAVKKLLTHCWKYFRGQRSKVVVIVRPNAFVQRRLHFDSVVLSLTYSSVLSFFDTVTIFSQMAKIISEVWFWPQSHLTHSDFETEQYIGNLIHPLGAPTIDLCFGSDISPSFPNFYRGSESAKFGLLGCFVPKWSNVSETIRNSGNAD